MRWFVAVAVLCVAHVVHSQGLLGNILGGASHAIDNVLGGLGHRGHGRDRDRDSGRDSGRDKGRDRGRDRERDHGRDRGRDRGRDSGRDRDQDRGDSCTQDVTDIYRKAQDNFYKNLYARVAARSDNHFVFSPYTIWLSLAALAEGADPSVQNSEFNSLYLPQKKCIRKQFYDIALHVEESGRDVKLRRRRSFILDENLEVNPDWAETMEDSGLLDVAVAPIKSNPKSTAVRLKEFLNTRSVIALKGNSILLDTLEYQGLWTTAFPESSVSKAPFYNDLGQQIGTVDMMRMKQKVRLAHLPFMTSKILELPVGENGRYTMLIAVGTGNSLIKNALESFLGSIFDIFAALQLSVIPIEIAIPKFAMVTEFDVTPALDDIGIKWFGRDPEATRYVSEPPAMPGSLVQRVTIKIDSKGVNPPPSRSDNNLVSGLVHLATDTASDVVSVVGHEFIANRPFMYALFDTKTHTCLFAGAYSRPNAE